METVVRRLDRVERENPWRTETSNTLRIRIDPEIKKEEIKARLVRPGLLEIEWPRAKGYLVATYPTDTAGRLAAHKASFMVGVSLGLLAVVMAIITRLPKEVAPATAYGS